MNIDRVTEVAHRLSSKALSVVEDVGACETGDDRDHSIGQSDYLVVGVPVPDALEYVTGELKSKMKADGWELKVRSESAALQNLIWTKGDSSLIVETARNHAGDDIVSVSGGTPCGKTGSIRHGQVSEDDPWYLAPTVDGPTIRDND